MNVPSERNCILALEAAVGGGSVSLRRGGEEIGLWIGDGSVSRAEDLLPAISVLLAENSMDGKSVERIAVSTGPGSYTGIRIGLATAMGLKNGWDVKCCGLSVLTAMAGEARGSQSVLSVVPMGRSSLCWQAFVAEESGLVPFSEIQVGDLPLLIEWLGSHPVESVVADNTVAELLNTEDVGSKVSNLGRGLATYIGKAVSLEEVCGGLEPIFVNTKW